jgi:hypothetical protein
MDTRVDFRVFVLLPREISLFESVANLQIRADQTIVVGIIWKNDYNFRLGSFPCVQRTNWFEDTRERPPER